MIGIKRIKRYIGTHSLNTPLNFIFHASAGLIIFLIGNTLLRKVLADFWVKAFAYPSDKLLFNIALMLLLVLVGFYLYQQRKNNSWIEIFYSIDLTVFIVSIYYDCCHPNDVSLIPVFERFPNFSYFDLTFIFFPILYGFLLNSILRKSKISFDNGYLKPDLSFFEQHENDTEEPVDLLKHRTFIQDIAKALKIINPHKGSFAIGINGPWGIGKSSFIFLLKKELLSDKKFEKETLFLWYQPLYSMPEENIVIHFLKWFEAKLRPESNIASKAVETYIKYLNSIQFSFSNFTINGIFSDDNSFDGIKKRIESTIDHLAKRIIIVIDDLDRLNAKEIIQVFHLIKYIASFRNAIYILAYDKDVVTLALKESSDKILDEKYLRKFIQLEFPLEILDPEQLKSIFKIELTNKLESLNLPYLSEVDYIAANYDIVIVLQNIRDIKRFLNSFMLALSIIHKQVEFRQFFLVQLIGYYSYSDQRKLFFYFPDVFDFFSTHESKKFHTHPLNTNHDAVTASERRFNELFPDPVVRKLINYIFEENKDFLWSPERMKNSFLNPAILHLYFTLTNFKNDIQEKDFAIALGNPMNKCNEQFIEWSNRNPARLLELVKTVRFDETKDTKTALNVFSSIFRVYEAHFSRWKTERSQTKHDIIVCFKDLLIYSKLVTDIFFLKLLDSISDDPLILSYFISDLLKIATYTDFSPLNRVILDKLYNLSNEMLPSNTELSVLTLQFLENLTTIIKQQSKHSNDNKLQTEYKDKILHRKRHEFLMSLPRLHDYFLVISQDQLDNPVKHQKRIIELIEGVLIDRSEIYQLNRPFQWVVQDIIDAYDNYIIYGNVDLTHRSPSEEHPDKNDQILEMNGNKVFDTTKFEFKIKVNPSNNSLWRFGFQFSSSHDKFSDERFTVDNPLIYFSSGRKIDQGVTMGEFQIGRFPNHLFSNRGGENSFSAHDTQTWNYEFEFSLSNKKGLKVMNNKGENIDIEEKDFLRKFPFFQIRAWSENEPFKISVMIKLRKLLNF